MKSQFSRDEVHDQLPALGSAEQDFYSMLSQAVDAARKDEAQLRKAIFEVLRARIQRQGWTRQPPVGIGEMKEYLSALDAAASRLEDESKADRARAKKLVSIEGAAQPKANIPQAKAEPKNVSVAAQQEPTAAGGAVPTPVPARRAERPLPPARDASSRNISSRIEHAPAATAEPQDVSMVVQQEASVAGDVAPAAASARRAERPLPPARDANRSIISTVTDRVPTAVEVEPTPVSWSSAGRPLPPLLAPGSQNSAPTVEPAPIAAGEIAPLPVSLSLEQRPFRTEGEPKRRSVSLIQPQAIAAWDLEPGPVALRPAKRSFSPVYEPRRRWSVALPVLRLTVAIILAGLLYAIVAGKVDLVGLRDRWHALFPIEEPHPIASVQPPSSVDQAVAPTTPALPLPAVYGVYAVSNGELDELSTLPLNVPDPKVFMSAPITSPSPTTLPDGRIVFIAFRRDLAANAPERVALRVVAKVRSALAFDAAGKPKLTSLDAQWVIRSNSYEFRVAPLKDHPEMIVIRPQSDDFSLPAGRYALALKGQAYDFSVAGAITDTAQCLERTEAVNGAVYSECRNP